MDIQVINLGARPNDGTGDDVRTAFGKTNANAEALATALADLTCAVADLVAVAGDALAVARGRARLGRTLVEDRDYAADPADVLIAYTRLSVGRACTIPRAADVTDGQPLRVADWSGACSPDRPLRLVAAFGDTIAGAPSAVLASGYAGLTLYSNGVDLWTF